MSNYILVGIAEVIFLGILAQWLAWRLRLPSILLLLVFGLVVGPITGLIAPDDLFGDVFFPIVSLSVGIILFEGGLGLRLRELPAVGTVVRNLISVGVLITWMIGAGAAYLLFNLSFSLAVLAGAILVVSGPTVILPLLRDIRPEGQVGAILRWEGILVDPIGAILALLVFDVIIETNLRAAAGEAAIALLQIVIIGVAVGWFGARLLALLLQRFLIPDHLENAFTLMAVITVFALANVLAQESGLLATTVMGVVLANQRPVRAQTYCRVQRGFGHRDRVGSLYPPHCPIADC